MGSQVARDHPDRRVADVASAQHGVISRAQLLAGGLGARAIDHRLAAGRLHPLHRGVYALGHRALTREGAWVAATLACGDGAVVSHFDAAGLWGLVAPRSGHVHVTVPTRAGRARRKGPGSTRTRSELEERFLALCTAHHLPRPCVNAVIEGYEVDFLWPAAGLVVETDGYAAHARRGTLERDHERDIRLRAAGYEVLRFTWRQVTARGYWVATSVADVLGERSSR